MIGLCHYSDEYCMIISNLKDEEKEKKEKTRRKRRNERTNKQQERPRED